MRFQINKIRNSFRQSTLIKDSFWAIFGNGLGNGLMLFAGIIIARYLGKDLYGEYGLIKTTMLYIGAFSTLGLMTTSTKYIAIAVKETPWMIKSLAKDAIFITLVCSGSLSLLFIIFAKTIASFLDEPDLTLSFRMLGIIIVFRSLQLTESGILGGLSKYNIIAKYNIISSFIMLVCAILLTYIWGLLGALIALLISQIINTILNSYYIFNYICSLKNQVKTSKKKELMLFSLPVALQAASYNICTWGATVILAKFSTIGQIGLYNAASQWYSIVLIVPSLLVNVILSHLSRTSNNQTLHNNILKKLLICNFICTFLPFITVYVLANWISGFYGPTFIGLPIILKIIVFSTIFSCCSNVYQSEFITKNKTWLTFSIRFIRDAGSLILCYGLIVRFGPDSGALSYSIAWVSADLIYFLLLVTAYYFLIKKKCPLININKIVNSK